MYVCLVSLLKHERAYTTMTDTHARHEDTDASMRARTHKQAFASRYNLYIIHTMIAVVVSRFGLAVRR